ncbi:MAG TPA: STAS domain-containing protein [Bacteroidales bacterium]|nr:STAS domain-containing protein [Bacteroidales bacterium]
MLRVQKIEQGKFEVNSQQQKRFNILFAEEAGRQLKELVSISGSRVYFNLENINFIDSAGFTVLREINKLAKEKDSSFVLCNITSDVMELIYLLNLGDDFRIGRRDFKKVKAEK